MGAEESPDRYRYLILSEEQSARDVLGAKLMHYLCKELHAVTERRNRSDIAHAARIEGKVDQLQCSVDEVLVRATSAAAAVVRHTSLDLGGVKKDACTVAKKNACTVAKKDACTAVKKDARAADKEDASSAAKGASATSFATKGASATSSAIEGASAVSPPDRGRGKRAGKAVRQREGA